MNNTVYGEYRGGGGVYSADSSPKLRNCVIVGNYSEHGSGGLHSRFSLTERLTSCILWDNVPDQVQQEYTAFGAPLLRCCNVMGGWEGEGNIDAAPLFRSLQNFDFLLGPGSPCIDAGDPDSFFVMGCLIGIPYGRLGCQMEPGRIWVLSAARRMASGSAGWAVPPFGPTETDLVRGSARSALTTSTKLAVRPRLLPPDDRNDDGLPPAGLHGCVALSATLGHLLHHLPHLSVRAAQPNTSKSVGFRVGIRQRGAGPDGEV